MEVAEASEERFVLVADRPISISGQYLLDPAADGTEVRASVSIEERGLLGLVLARATCALLAAGALNKSVDRIGRQLERALGA